MREDRQSESKQNCRGKFLPLSYGVMWLSVSSRNTVDMRVIPHIQQGGLALRAASLRECRNSHRLELVGVVIINLERMRHRVIHPKHPLFQR